MAGDSLVQPHEPQMVLELPERAFGTSAQITKDRSPDSLRKIVPLFEIRIQ